MVGQHSLAFVGQDGIRMASCGRLVIGLPDRSAKYRQHRGESRTNVFGPEALGTARGRPIANRPQVINLPHKKIAAACEEPNAL
jgi:hypothetical protein